MAGDVVLGKHTRGNSKQSNYLQIEGKKEQQLIFVEVFQLLSFNKNVNT
jgi:hypothetical protein